MSDPESPDGEETAEELLEKARKLIEQALEKEVGEGSTFENFEEEVLKRGNEIQRRILEDELQKRSDALAAQVRVRRNDCWPQHGVEFRQHQRSASRYFTLCGPVTVHRFRYRRKWARGKSLVLLDETEGLIEKMTPAMARCLAHGYANQPIRLVREEMLAAHRCPPPRATMERKAKSVGSQVDRVREDLERVIRLQETVPEGAVTVVVGLDRTSVPMEEDAEGSPKPRKNPRIRKAPRPVKVEYRMDYVGTVQFLDEQGESVACRYFRAASKQSVNVMAARLADEVEVAVGRQPTLRVTVVQDGAVELWNALRHELEARALSFTETLDWYHVSERLTSCANLWPPETQRRQREKWTKELLTKNEGATRFVRRLKRHAKRLPDGKAEELNQHVSYFESRLPQMNYASRRQQNLPIGSGVTEGACKSLISGRAKRSGQRWRPQGLGAALSLRAFRMSDRFDSMWTELRQIYTLHASQPL